VNGVRRIDVRPTGVRPIGVRPIGVRPIGVHLTVDGVKKYPCELKVGMDTIVIKDLMNLVFTNEFTVAHIPVTKPPRTSKRKSSRRRHRPSSRSSSKRSRRS